LGAVKTERKT